MAIRPITFVGSTVNQGNVATPNTTVPAGTAAGDRLVMVLSLNDTTRTVGTPDRRDRVDPGRHRDSGTMQTNVYTKVAPAGDAGKTVRFAMDAAAKYTMTIAAYSGDMLAPQFAQGGRDGGPRRAHHPDHRGRGRRLGGVLLGRQVLEHDRLHAPGRRHLARQRSAAPPPDTSAARSRTPQPGCPPAPTAG